MGDMSNLKASLARTDKTEGQFLPRVFATKNGLTPTFTTLAPPGAFDGETFSNTLYLEKKKGWTGVLVSCSGHLSVGPRAELGGP
jgi:hypothetical protein